MAYEVQMPKWGLTMVAEEALDYLDAPIVRVGAPYCPVPFSPPLEKAYIPGADQIVAAVKSLR